MIDKRRGTTASYVGLGPGSRIAIICSRTCMVLSIPVEAAVISREDVESGVGQHDYWYERQHSDLSVVGRCEEQRVDLLSWLVAVDG